MPDARMDGAADIRDEIRSRFVVLLTKDCNTHPGLLDFYEIRFDKAMVALRTTVLRKIGPATRKIKTVPLGSQDDEGPEISAEVEAALEEFLSGDPQKIDDPAFRLVLFAAIDHLPQDQYQVVQAPVRDIECGRARHATRFDLAEGRHARAGGQPERMHALGTAYSQAIRC